MVVRQTENLKEAVQLRHGPPDLRISSSRERSLRRGGTRFDSSLIGSQPNEDPPLVTKQKLSSGFSFEGDPSTPGARMPGIQEKDPNMSGEPIPVDPDPIAGGGGGGGTPPPPRPCPTCGGKGFCPICKGEPRKMITLPSGDQFQWVCNMCLPRLDGFCPACHGSGTL